MALAHAPKDATPVDDVAAGEMLAAGPANNKTKGTHAYHRTRPMGKAHRPFSGPACEGSADTHKATGETTRAWKMWCAARADLLRFVHGDSHLPVHRH